MPIVYVHGVANRLDGNDSLPGWDEIASNLRHYIAPVISPTSERVPIMVAYWGDDGVRFGWKGISRPRSKLRGQGPGSSATLVEQISELGGLQRLPAIPPGTASQGMLTSGRTAIAAPSSFHLSELSADQLSDFLSAALDHIQVSTRLKTIADDVAHDPSIRERMDAAANLEEELDLLHKEITARSAASSLLAAQGAGGWWNDFADRAREVAIRVNSAPAYAVSRLAMELRAPINDAVTTFIGDVFEYVSQRHENPGKIREAVFKVLLEAKKQAEDPNEPVIVVSHSMGGQIVFDIATSLLGPELRIDFWAATASQVGLFEEMKLLLASDPVIQGPNQRAPFPSNVGWWWNVWDSNDVLSYTARDIFDLQVDDEEWNSGASVADAHGAYLRRPSFYRELAKKIQTAQEIDFNRR